MREILKQTSIFKASRTTNIKEYDFGCSIENKDCLNDFQGGTSYCWMYSCISMLKCYGESYCSIPDCEFSYAYLQFYDKLERVKYALDLIFNKEYLKSNFNSQLKFLTSDRGSFDIFVSLIDKYGVVFKKDMPDTYCVSNSYDLNYVLHNFLINIISKLERGELLSKEDILIDVYKLLEDCYGTPPDKIKFKNLWIEPQKLYAEYMDGFFNKYICIANFNEDEYINRYCCYDKRINFISGNNVPFINLKSVDFKRCILEQLKESSTYLSMKITDADLKLGVFDDLYKLDETLKLSIVLDKQSFMKYKEDVNEHALILVGADVNDGVINKWKVKDNNRNIGKNGYCLLSSTWFDKYVCCVVVNKDVFNRLEIKVLNNDLIAII